MITRNERNPNGCLCFRKYVFAGLLLALPVPFWRYLLRFFREERDGVKKAKVGKVGSFGDGAKKCLVNHLISGSWKCCKLEGQLFQAWIALPCFACILSVLFSIEVICH